jgi:hypothetical protein
VGVAAGTVALWLSPLNDVGSPLVDASGNGHTLIEAGAVPTVTGAGIAKGQFGAGPTSGTRYYRNATARTALSGATTFRAEFDNMFPTLGTQIFWSVGNTNADNILLQLNASAGVNLIVNDAIIASTANGIIKAGEKYRFILTSTGGVMKVYSGVVNDGPSAALPERISISPADPNFPSNGSIWLGVYGVAVGFQPSVSVMNNVRLMSVAGNGGVPTLDTVDAPTQTGLTYQGMVLAWNDNPKAAFNKLYRTITPTFDPDAVFGCVANGAEELDAFGGWTPEQTYYIWREAYTAWGSFIERSEALEVTIPAAPSVVPPDAPTALEADASDRQTAALSWTAEPTADFYHIEKAVSPFSSWTPAGLANQGDEGATIAGLTPGTVYRFRVTSENAAGLGDPSAAVEVEMPEAPEASDLAAEADGLRDIRATWNDAEDSSAGYVGYIGTSDDFNAATQFGFAPAGQEHLVARDLAYETQYWLWLVAVDSLGFGPTVGPVTATTAAQQLPGALDVAAVRNALRAFIVSALPGREVIWRYEGGTKPAKGFVELHLVGPMKLGQDEQGPGYVAGPRRFSLTVRCFGDKQETVLQDALMAQGATDRVDLLAPLQAAGLAFGEVGNVQDTSGLLGTKYEARHEFEVDVHASQLTAVDDGQIETATLGNGLPAEP